MVLVVRNREGGGGGDGEGLYLSDGVLVGRFSILCWRARILCQPFVADFDRDDWVVFSNDWVVFFNAYGMMTDFGDDGSGLLGGFFEGIRSNDWVVFFNVSYEE